MSFYVGNNPDPLLHVTTGTHDIGTMRGPINNDTIVHSDIDYITYDLYTFNYNWELQHHWTDNPMLFSGTGPTVGLFGSVRSSTGYYSGALYTATNPSEEAACVSAIENGYQYIVIDNDRSEIVFFGETEPQYFFNHYTSSYEWVDREGYYGWREYSTKEASDNYVSRPIASSTRRCFSLYGTMYAYVDSDPYNASTDPRNGLFPPARDYPTSVTIAVLNLKRDGTVTRPAFTGEVRINNNEIHVNGYNFSTLRLLNIKNVNNVDPIFPIGNSTLQFVNRHGYNGSVSLVSRQGLTQITVGGNTVIDSSVVAQGIKIVNNTTHNFGYTLIVADDSTRQTSSGSVFKEYYHIVDITNDDILFLTTSLTILARVGVTYRFTEDEKPKQHLIIEGGRDQEYLLAYALEIVWQNDDITYALAIEVIDNSVYLVAAAFSGNSAWNYIPDHPYQYFFEGVDITTTTLGYAV